MGAKARLLSTAAGLLAIAAAVTSSATGDTCGAMPCRSNGAPYINEKGSIIIYPGEHFAIAFKIENGKIVGAVPEPAGSQRANAVEVSFEQTETGMMLSLESRLASTIKYDATMKAPDDRLVYTSTCPVEAGLSAFESWPHAIKFMEPSNFRFQQDGPCE